MYKMAVEKDLIGKTLGKVYADPILREVWMGKIIVYEYMPRQHPNKGIVRGICSGWGEAMEACSRLARRKALENIVRKVLGEPPILYSAGIKDGLYDVLIAS
jgi:hypothetical protein